MYAENSHPPKQGRGTGNKINMLLYVLIGVVAVVGSIITAVLITGHSSKKNTETEQEDQTEEQSELLDNIFTASELTENGTQQSRHEQESTVRQRKKSLLADYENILRRNPNEVYFVSDINNNGFPELWITYRYGKHYDNQYHVYHSEKGHAREIYTTDDGSIFLTDGGRVMIYSSLYGTKYLRRYNYDGNRITCETLYNSERDNYNSYNIPGDRSIPATDFSVLRNAFAF